MKKSASKNSRFEVDQSIRIEELNKDTVIGIANPKQSFSYILSRKTKRYFNEYFRRLGKPRRCAPLLFTAAVIISLKKGLGQDVTSLIIDIEYAGYESLVRRSLQLFYPQAVIVLKHIGRLSPAHQVAYGAHIGKKKVNGILRRSELEAVIRSINKNDGRRAASPGMNRDSQTHNRPVKKKYTKRK